MALLETSGFDTGEIRRALDEYDRREQRRSVQMGAVFLQSMRLLEDAGRLYEENDKLREMAAQALQIIKHVNVVMAIDYARYSALMSMARELGIEVE